MKPRKRQTSQSGISLLEVLIALLILSLGALGFAGLQLKGLKTTEDANYRAHATLIAQDAIERVLSNPGQADRYFTSNNWPSSPVAPGAQPSDWKKCMTNSCSATEMANWDIAQLNWIAANSLPVGRVMATDCTFNSNIQCVIVSWGGMTPSACTTATGINTEGDSTCLVLEVIR